MKSLKILQVCNRLPWPLNDGGNLATYNVTKHLHDKGHQVVLASLNTYKHHQDPDLLRHVAKVHVVDIDTSLRALPMLLGLVKPIPYNVERFISPEFEKLLQKLIKKEQPDIIQLEGSYQAIFIKAIREVCDVPVILRSHNVEWKIWERLFQNEKNWLKKFYLSSLYKKIRNFEKARVLDFDGIIAITEEDKAWYKAIGYKGSLCTINAGADLSKYQPLKEWAPVHKVGFIGSLEWQPNVEGIKWFVEEVWGKVRLVHPEAEFHLAGKHPPEWMKDWKVTGMVFHGMVPDAVDFLRQFRIFIVPLLSGSGMRLKIVEAMAMRKCVLSTTVGSEGIAIQSERDYICADQAADFAKALCDLLANSEKTKTLAKNGLNQVKKHYDWNQLIDQFIDFYNKLI